MLAVTMPQGGLVWPFHWSLMSDRTSPVAMDTDLTSGSSVDNENTTLSQLLDAFQEDDEKTSMAPLSGIGSTDRLISVPFLNGNMDMNNDLLDLTKPLEGLQHGISSMSLDSLNNDNFVDAVEVQTEQDESCLSGISELNSCPETDVESVIEDNKEKDQLLPEINNIQEIAGSDSVKVSVVSRSPESYTTLYRAFEIAQEEPIDTDECDQPRESTLDMLNRTSPKLQRVALRKAKITPEKKPPILNNPVVSDQKIVTTLSKQSHLKDSSLNLTWKRFENSESVTTFADILQKKESPSPKSENFTNLGTNDCVHWTELMQDKSDSEGGNGVARRTRRTKRISRPKSLPIQLRHIRRPAVRPIKTPEDKQSKAYENFIQFQTDLNALDEENNSSAVKTQSAPTPRKTQWEASTPVAMDTRTSPSSSPPSLNFLPFYLKRQIRCNEIPAVTSCFDLRGCYQQNGSELDVDNIPVTLSLQTREAPDGVSESPSNKLNLILTSNEKMIMIDDNANINANVKPVNHELGENSMFSSDSESEEKASDSSEDGASLIDFETGASEKFNGQSGGLLHSNEYDWVSLESVLKAPFHMDGSTQQFTNTSPQQTLHELDQSIYDTNGNSLSKHMPNNKGEFIVRTSMTDTTRRDIHHLDLNGLSKTWPNQKYNWDKIDRFSNSHWNTFDYLDAEETFLPLEPLPDYADTESLEQVQISTRCSSTTLLSPSELDTDSFCGTDNELFYLGLPPGHGKPNTSLRIGHSKRLNSMGGTDASSTTTDISSPLSSLSELQICKNSGAPDLLNEIPFQTKSNDTSPSGTNTDYICYRPMRKLSEAEFLQHNLQDPMKENNCLKTYMTGKSISPAQKSLVIPDPESAGKSRKGNPRLIHDLLEKLKEQAVDLELRRLKRTFPVKRQASAPAAPKRKEVTFTGVSRVHHPRFEDTIQYIDHKPLKPIHVVDEEYRWRTAQKDIRKPKDMRGYYEPTYMSHGYHTLPAVLNWYKNRQDIYTDQSHTSFKKRSPIRNRMADSKTDVYYGKEVDKDLQKRDAIRSVAVDDRPATRGVELEERDATRRVAVEGIVNEDEFDDWQDLQVQELPPQDITVSPRPSKQARNVDMVVMKGLVTAVSSAVDIILHHFSRTSEMGPQDKAVLGDTVKTPIIGLLVLDHLCPAIANILKDGMKPYIRNYIIGRAKNSIWQVVEATTELGPGTRSLYELVCLIQEQKSLSTDELKFNAFIFGLLSTKCLEVWLNHIRHHPDIVQSYFEKNAFLSQCSTSTYQLFNDLLVAVQPLSLLPFKLALDFELKYTQKQTYRTRNESFTTDPQPLMSLPWLGRSGSRPRTLSGKDDEQRTSWQSWASPSNILDSFRTHKEPSNRSGVQSMRMTPEPQKSDASWMKSKEMLKTAIIGRDTASLKKRTAKSQVSPSSSSLAHTWRKSKNEVVQTKEKTFQTQRKTVKHDSISPKTERNQLTEGVRSQPTSSRSWSLGWMTGAVSKKLYGEESQEKDVRYPIIGADGGNSGRLQRPDQSEEFSERPYPSTSVMDNIGSNVIKAFDYMLLPKQSPKEFQMVEMRRTRQQKAEDQRRQRSQTDESRCQTSPSSYKSSRRTAPSSDEERRQTTPPSPQQKSVKTRCHNVSMQHGFLSFSKDEILQVKHRIDKELLLCSRCEETGLVYEAHVEKIKSTDRLL